MTPLIVNDFVGSKTVAENSTLKTNAVFFSRLNNFEGKLTNSHVALKVPLVGIENYYVNKAKYQLGNDSYMVTNVGHDIEGVVKGKDLILGLCILFQEDFIANLLGSMEQTLAQGVDSPFDTEKPITFITQKQRLNNDPLSIILHKIKDDLLSNKLEEKYTIEQFYLTLGECLIQNQFSIYSNINKLPQSKLSTRSEIYRRVNIMDDFIHSNYKQDITLDQLSLISCLSKYHAIRSYQKINNISPYQKIQDLRLEEAKRLLKEGLNISEVADKVNFSDHRALSKSFKKRYKLTPTEYRQVNN